MAKLIGYVPMKKCEGLVLFLTEKGGGSCVGEQARTEFLYDAELCKKISPQSVGHEIELSYGRGYNGKAFISGVLIK